MQWCTLATPTLGASVKGAFPLLRDVRMAKAQVRLCLYKILFRLIRNSTYMYVYPCVRVHHSTPKLLNTRH